MGVRMLLDYWRLRRWEREVLQRGVHTDGALTRALRAVPWSGVTIFAFVMLFFGVDLGASVHHTSRQVQESKTAAQDTADNMRRQSKQWSLEQVKQFRKGELPQASWSEGGPRMPKPTEH